MEGVVQRLEVVRVEFTRLGESEKNIWSTRVLKAWGLEEKKRREERGE